MQINSNFPKGKNLRFKFFVVLFLVFSVFLYKTSDFALGATGDVALTGSAFSDTDAEDTFNASQWVVRDSGSTVYDQVAGAVTTIMVPAATFTDGTTYFWKVRYQDQHLIWGDYSAESSFLYGLAPPDPTPTATPTSMPTATISPTVVPSTPTPTPGPTVEPSDCLKQCIRTEIDSGNQSPFCAIEAMCRTSCGTVADAMNIKPTITSPNGEESYAIGSEADIKWRYGDARDSAFGNEPVSFAISIDGGVSYTNQMVLFPGNKELPYDKQHYLDRENVSAYGYFDQVRTGELYDYVYKWNIPVSAALISPLTRIKLTPIVGCAATVPDSSDANFTILPLAKTISVYLTPEKKTIKPNEAGTFTANAYNELGQLINGSVDFNFELKTQGAQIISTNQNVLTIEAGTIELNYPNSIKVTASYNGLESFYFASLRVSSQTPVMDRVVLEPDIQTIDQNDTFTYHALVLDQFGEIFPSATIDWSLLEPSAGTLVPLPNDPSRAVFTGTRPGCYSYIIKAVASANGISYFDVASVRVKVLNETIPTAFEPFSRLTRLAINS